MSKNTPNLTFGESAIRGRYSLTEFVELMNSESVVNPDNLPRLKRFREDGNLHWYGLSKDAKDGEKPTNATMRLIRNGWKRGVKLMQEVAASVEAPTPRSIRRRAEWSDQGDEVEMQRVWGGNLDRAWRRTRKLSGVGPRRVRILVDSIAGGGEDSDSMRWRGVAAMRAADLLVDAGYAVQVESVFKGGDSPKDFYLDVVVKSYTDPLDMTSLAATTALPAFFRALGHDWHFYASEVPTSAGYSVGRAKLMDFPSDDDDAVELLVSQSVNSRENAAAWVAEAIKQIDADADAE
jgi:hypothetical protein